MSVARDLQNIVVLAGVPPQARPGINKPDLIEGLAGVPAAVSGISEALVMTGNGVRESVGQIAALPRKTAVGFGDGIRGRRPSVPNPDILSPDFLNPDEVADCSQGS
jgi:hypothetical protein